MRHTSAPFLDAFVHQALRLQAGNRQENQIDIARLVTVPRQQVQPMNSTTPAQTRVWQRTLSSPRLALPVITISRSAGHPPNEGMRITSRAPLETAAALVTGNPANGCESDKQEGSQVLLVVRPLRAGSDRRQCDQSNRVQPPLDNCRPQHQRGCAQSQHHHLRVLCTVV